MLFWEPVGTRYSKLFKKMGPCIAHHLFHGLIRQYKTPFTLTIQRVASVAGHPNHQE